MGENTTKGCLKLSDNIELFIYRVYNVIENI